MARGKFALGLVVGGLAGLFAGYYVSRVAETGDEAALRSVDLKPAIELNQNRAAGAAKRAMKSASPDGKEGAEE